MTDDLISRADAIEWLKKAHEAGNINPYTSIQRKCDFEEAINCIEAIPSAQPKIDEWIFHYRDKWMVKAECPKCHLRFQFPPRTIWKCCPMCETRMKGADDE